MRSLNARHGLLVLVVGLAILQARASDETGNYVGVNCSGSSHNVSGDDHDTPGVCNTTLEGNYAGSTYGTWMDASTFPLAGGAGISTCKFGPSKYEKVSITERQVKIKTVDQKVITVYPGDPNHVPAIPPYNVTVLCEGSATGASFPASCHEPKAAATTTNTGEKKETGNNVDSGQKPASDGGIKHEPRAPDFGFHVFMCGFGLQHLFHYSVTNNCDVPMSFTWPAVHTPDHPDGWSATVEANSTLDYEYIGLSDGVLVHGSAGAVTVVADGDESVVVARHVTDTWCPVNSVTIPSPALGLSASSGTNAVALCWTNSQSYDSIQVIRTISGHLPRSWDVGGTQQTFVDDDPPMGEIRYEVIGVKSGLGAEENPAVEITRN